MEVPFVKATLGMLASEEVDFTLFFRHLTLHAANDSTCGSHRAFLEPSPL